MAVTALPLSAHAAGAALDLPASSSGAAALPLLGSPLAARLLEFNLLPSRSLHPSRRALLRPAIAPAFERLAALPRVARELHRDWSTALLEAFDGEARRPVLAAGEPALPLALAQPEVLARLARDAGLVLLGRHLRRTVLRADVAAAREAIGAEGLAFARGPAADLHPGLDNADDVGGWLPQGAASLPGAADLLGAGVLAQAWHDAAPALRRRADLKLPAEADAPRVREASGLRAAAARDLCLTLMNRIEPAWLSLFPTPAATR
jgi:type III secretion protein K